MAITLFDIPSKFPENAWSPNTFKARYIIFSFIITSCQFDNKVHRIALNYKGIPYKTQWIEYPDIEETLKKLGGTPTSTKDDGRDHYTLPAIHDSTTRKTITDSMDIAVYLEEKYPDTPSLFPKGTRAATELLNYHFMTTVSAKLLPLLLPPTCLSLNPPSAEYFRRTREQSYGKTLEEFAPPGPARDEAWAKVKEGLELLASIYAKNGEGKPYFFGEAFSYADAIVAGFLVWARIVVRPESEEWKAVASWNDGRWAKLLDLVEKDLVVV